MVLEFQPQRQDLTFYLTTVNTYLAERSGARAPWALVQPVVPGKAQLFVEGHSVGMATPYGGTIMGQIECERHTITYHAGFITQIDPLRMRSGSSSASPLSCPTDDARESLVPLTVTIPRRNQARRSHPVSVGNGTRRSPRRVCGWPQTSRSEVSRIVQIGRVIRSERLDRVEAGGLRAG